MDHNLQFARITNPVCSCGEYVGRWQSDIEFKLIKISQTKNRPTDDRDISNILNEMKVTKMCCRREIIVSPVLRLLKIGNTFNVGVGSDFVSSTFDRLIIGKQYKIDA